MRILFLNDLGFQYGAGIAQARQIQSLLLGGHTVGAICGANGEVGDHILFTRSGLEQGWRGIRTLDSLFASTDLLQEELIDGILMAAAEFYPDIVVVGNLHSTSWPLQIVEELTCLGCKVVAYMHDLHLITGRCTYPGDCDRYLSGCDENCPTPGEYPALAPDRIAGAWKLRRELFNRSNLVKLVSNSEYVRKLASHAFPKGNVVTVYYGADETVFQPVNRLAARNQLGLAPDVPTVLVGAVNLRETRKGASHIASLVERFQEDVQFISFGHPSPDLPTVRALGYHTDANQLARIYSSADLFVSAATEEAFGQVILEASLCATPVVAFAAGGIPEIIQNGKSGLLVPVGNANELGDAVELLLHKPKLREEMGHAARDVCVKRFSLKQQLIGWTELLTQLCTETHADL